MTKRGLLLWAVTVALLTSAMPSWAAPGTTPSGPKAGSITALLPTAKITRGSGKKAVTSVAKKGDELVWNDLVQTEKGGRARITLTDQSILSLGSQAQLRIVKHDARAQQTALEMAYGRVRAQVANITRDGGNFELRTPTAVAGVIGTDFGVDSSSIGGDTFVCIAGAVQVSNSNKTVAGSVQCTAGQTTTVQPGKPPSPPQPASPQQIQQLIADTEPAIIASINPASSLPGANFDATIAGQNMASITAASISGTGVTVTFKSAAATGVTVHVAIDANAAPGPRTITLTKPAGASSATVFSVQGAPSGDKQSYLTTLQQLAATGSGGLGGLVTGAQQSADQIAQAVTNANLNLKKPIDLTAFANSLNQNYTQLQTQLQGQTAAVQTAEQNAVTQFGSSFDGANTSLQQGKLSQTDYQAAVTKAFNDANTAIQTAITGAQSTLNGELQTYASTLNQLQTDWFANINEASAGGPAPKVNALERDVNLGDSASFDASGSSATNGASIQSTSWVLCAPSYQPSGFGTPLDSSVSACTPVQGAGAAVSTQSEITIPTCNLSPGNYYVRLTLTDTNAKVTPMDVKLVVLPPTYGTPTQTLQGLASAYQGLQYGPYSAYFDSTAPGVATYLNSVQQTLPTLNSMTVHIISSQDTITCNDASTYATWQLNYSYKSNPAVLLDTNQPLQVAMHRTPGVGWQITNVIAQNGLQQGAIPGPLVTQTASPDLQVDPASVLLDGNAIGANASVFPSTHTVTATIKNIGAADFTSTDWKVTFSATSKNGKTIPMYTASQTTGIASGGILQVTGTLALPPDTDGDIIAVTVNANPDCGSIAEANCANNVATFALTVQNNQITFANVTTGLTILQGGPAGTISMDVASTFYPVQVCSSVLNGVTISGSNTGVKPAAPGASPTCKSLSAAGTLTFSVAADTTAPSGVQSDVFTATNSGNSTAGVPGVTATVAVPVTISIPPTYVITGVSFVNHTAPYTGANALQVGESAQLAVVIANQGSSSPTGTVTVSANCNSTTNCTPVTGTIAAPAVGTPVTLTIPLNSVGLAPGSYTGTATVTTNVAGAFLGPAFNLPFDVVDFSISVAPANLFTPAQNLPIGGTGMICVDVTEQLASGSAFPVSITPTAAAGVTFTPATQSSSGNCIPFTAAVASSVPPSSTTPDSIMVTATNRGVSRTLAVPIPVNYFNAQLTSLNLFVNNSGNPLTVPVATSAGAPSKYDTLNLQMAGNFTGGPAQNLTMNPTCGSYTPLLQTSAQPGDPVTWPIYANVGTNCPATTQIAIQATIPNTNPATPQTVYTLYVAPKGLAQLQVMSITPSRDLTSQPWLAGEPMDWTVTVKNVGSGPSSGNEKVTLTLNGAQVGNVSLGATPIAANGTGQVSVHTDAPDFPSSLSGSASYTLLAHVDLDTQGDLAPGTGDLTQTVNISNWSIGVSGAGSSDGTPVTLTVGGSAATANVGVTALSSGTFNPNLALGMVLGSYSSNQLNPSTFSPSSISSSAGTTVSMSIQSAQSPVSGYYFVQVIAQMKDGANVTAQRQATIHVVVSNVGLSPAFISLASDQNNIAQCANGAAGGCGAAPSTLQINGPLPDAVNLTATVSGCSPGTCPTGNVDVSFTDSFMTTTTPPTTTVGVSSPGNTLPIRVKAATNPDGSINTGTATVFASVSAIQAAVPSSARQPNPDPVGNDQFALAFNVGDILVSSSACVGVQPSNTTATPLNISWTPVSGFNVSSISWEWEDPNHLQVTGTPLLFSTASGTSSFSSGTYTALPTFNLQNRSTTGVDGVQTYYFAVTISNGLATATKYFPFMFDLSQSQTFCPAAGGARGFGGGQIIRGSWGKSGLIAAAHIAVRPSGSLPDVRISSSDVSFTPSMPKTGDTVSVRFRASNVGDVNATAVPIALQVNGSVVASDTFDVPVGKTVLGALQWNNAQVPAPSSVTPGRAATSRLSRPSRGGAPVVAPVSTSVLNVLNAAIVVDPLQKTQQKTTTAKSAPLAHFSLHEGTAASTIASGSIARQRVVLELGEGGCAGLRFTTGVASCGGADVAFNVEDLAKGVYTLQATNGIADLGTASLLTTTANAARNFGPQAAGQTGHTYAVQLRDGSVAMFTLTAVRNPNQLSEAAQRVFRGPASRMISRIGKNTAAPEPAATQESRVYFDIVYQGQ